ncbi:unnamed protein product [Mytilus coruscus]|uniref:Uncharacterized protein n=1 Tax=Mytilus coruscus TaxID=42192 RepID=A0A6J8EN92_MYTCO|nr:unnamed protein product [Mytilus coruscus]
MRCKYHFDNGSHQYNRHPFLSKSGYKPNWANNAIENYLFSTRIELEKIQIKSFKNNLPKNERKALQSLRSNDHIIIKKADKNSSTVVLDKELYIKMANDQFNDNVHYEKINESPTTEILDSTYAEYHQAQIETFGKLVDFAKQKGIAFHSISELITPSNFKVLLSTVKKLAGYNPIERSYDIPTLPAKIGYCLRRCAEINKSAGISANDKSKITNAKNFLSLYDADWNSRMSSVARQTSQINKCNFQKLLPLCSDIQVLFRFVKEEGERVRKENCYVDHIFVYPVEVSLLTERRAGRRRLRRKEKKRYLLLNYYVNFINFYKT